MIQFEVNKINHVDHKRIYSDSGYYVKLPGTEELLSEIVSDDLSINGVETDVLIVPDEEVSLTLAEEEIVTTVEEMKEALHILGVMTE